MAWIVGVSAALMAMFARKNLKIGMKSPILITHVPDVTTCTNYRHIIFFCKSEALELSFAKLCVAIDS